MQTPYPARMRVHWGTGACLYNNTAKAVDDVKKRDYNVEVPRGPEPPWEGRFVQALCWKKAGGDKTERIRET